MSEWVDLQLSHQMVEVIAPEELWERIQTPRPRRRRRPAIALASAGAILALIAVAYTSTRTPTAPRPSSFASGTCNACHTM